MLIGQKTQLPVYHILYSAAMLVTSEPTEKPPAISRIHGQPLENGGADRDQNLYPRFIPYERELLPGCSAQFLAVYKSSFSITDQPAEVAKDGATCGNDL